MVGNRVQGLADTYALFGALPDAARDELGIELAILAREGLAAQKAAAPEDTGALSAGLSMQLQIDQLRVRFGLLGLTGSRSNLFYGRIVNFGRSAQTVLVQRRRRVNGSLRVYRGRKRLEDISVTYSLPVKARDAVPFIDAAGADFGDVAAGQLAEFWARTLARAGSPA